MTQEELEELFPIGTVVKVVRRNRSDYGNINAKIGATATVYGYTSYLEGWLVKIHWIRNELSSGQADGGYYPEYFVRDVPAIDRKRFPHKCPHCNSPAYIGLNYIECSNKCQ